MAIPAAPTNFRIVGLDYETEVSWDASENATGYVVYWGPASGDYDYNHDVGNETEYTIETSAGTWYWAVKAYTTQGYSDYSVEQSFTVGD